MSLLVSNTGPLIALGAIDALSCYRNCTSELSYKMK